MFRKKIVFFSGIFIIYKIDMLKKLCTNFDKQAKTTDTGKKMIKRQGNNKKLIDEKSLDKLDAC